MDTREEIRQMNCLRELEVEVTFNCKAYIPVRVDNRYSDSDEIYDLAVEEANNLTDSEVLEMATNAEVYDFECLSYREV